MTTPLGEFIRCERKAAGLSLRALEKMVGVSNAYISQLEHGKIRRPSPIVLYDLSIGLGIPHETLMEKAGYVRPSPAVEGKPRGISIDGLSEDEERELRRYLAYLRWKDGTFMKILRTKDEEKDD